MGLFDFLKPKPLNNSQNQKNVTSSNQTVAASSSAIQNSPNCFVDASTVSPDERSFYQPDNYYTFYSYPGTAMAQRVITFEERKMTSYPSSRGLYVAEIMLLEYCSQGKYPKPKSGYPGFWWFKYGIRDVGHALESLEQRGFIQWASKAGSLKGLKVDELKQLLTDAGLPTTGKKDDLINRIIAEIPDTKLIIPNYVPKYELTVLGKTELEDNGYVPYMHRHSHATTEDDRFGPTFNVWDINRMFPDGKASNWRQVVGGIEKKLFGVDMANADTSNGEPKKSVKVNNTALRDEMRSYLASKKTEIAQGIRTNGDGFNEESKGLDYKATGRDKEALVMFYIAIGKRFDAPALYREAAVLLRKYGMYEEELYVINEGLKNVPHNNNHWNALNERKLKVQELINKNK